MRFKQVIPCLGLFPPLLRIHASACEADGHTFGDAASLALRPHTSVVRPIVDLDELPGHPLVLQVLIDTALADLPDANALVVPDLAVAHGQDDFEDNVILDAPDDGVDEVRVEFGDVSR